MSFLQKRVVDAAGLVVAPGFIDVHGHLDGHAYAGQLSAMQGITTTVGGNCGLSPLDLEAGSPDRRAQAM